MSVQLAAAVLALEAILQPVHDFDIPAGTLKDSLRVVMSHRVTLLFDWGDRDARLNAVHCHCVPSRALELLFEGTGFTFEVTEHGAFAITRVRPCRPERADLATPPPCLPPELTVRL